MKYIVISNFLC